MANYEIFKNPTVIEVVFEIRFPPINFIPEKIGEFQLAIMDKFPQSEQIFEQQFPILTSKSEINTSKIMNDITIKWLFHDEEKKNIVTLKSNRLNIISKEYKSYNHPEHPKFRELIEYTISKFFGTFPIKKIERIGLRYIDVCPLERKNTEYFTRYYKPFFNIEQFKIEDILENFFLVRMKKDPYRILFQSKINRNSEGKYRYIMDFDGYTLNILSKNYLKITDELYEIIHNLYFNNITDQFKDYMRGKTCGDE